MKFETIMEIDLNKLKKNTKKLCKSYSDYKYKIASLKDNAHAMGFKIVPTLVSGGINYIQAGSLKDALEIRKYDSKIPIFVSYYVTSEEIYDCINNNIAITIPDLDYLNSLLDLKIKDELKMHILIDNGSNKLGIKSSEELNTAIKLINDNKYFTLEGLWSEITTFGIEDEYYYDQMTGFYDVIKDYIDSDLIIHLNEPIMYHTKKDYISGIHFDLSLLGIEENIPDSFFRNMHIKSIGKKYGDLEFPNINLELIFNITSEVMAIREAKKGTLIGRNFVAKNDMMVALMPIGHKDGITKAINFVGINGIKRQVLADEIDYLIVEVDENVKIKDKVYLINEEREIYDFLNMLHTNRYYLMSILNKGLFRSYINGDLDTTEDYL